MNARLTAALLAALVLAGCASQRIAPELPVSAAVQAQVEKQFAHELGLQKASYEQAQRMHALGYCTVVRPYEPFILMTAGTEKSPVTPEQRAAYARLGVDHQARVVWVDPTVSPNLKVGDVVAEINGRDVDPDEPYSLVVAARKGRYDLKPGEPLTVALADGRVVKLVGKAGCEAGIHGSFFDPFPFQMSFDLTPGVKLPTNLLAQAETADDLRWLAAFALYMTSSPEAESRRSKARLAAAPGLLGHLALAAIPGGGWLSGKYVSESILFFGLDGIYAPAAEFATRELHALGFDPARGVELIARAKARQLQIGAIELKPEEFATLRKLAADLKAGTAGAPSYELPTVARQD